MAKSGFEKFIPEFNSYIDEQNESAYNQNLLTAGGYLLAFFTAILSAFLTINKYSENLNSATFKIEEEMNQIK